MIVNKIDLNELYDKLTQERIQKFLKEGADEIKIRTFEEESLEKGKSSQKGVRMIQKYVRAEENC